MSLRSASFSSQKSTLYFFQIHARWTTDILSLIFYNFVFSFLFRCKTGFRELADGCPTHFLPFNEVFKHFSND